MSLPLHELVPGGPLFGGPCVFCDVHRSQTKEKRHVQHNQTRGSDIGFKRYYTDSFCFSTNVTKLAINYGIFGARHGTKM